MKPKSIKATVFLHDAPVGTGGLAIEQRFRNRRTAIEFARSVSLGHRWVHEGPHRVLLTWHGRQWDWWFTKDGIERLEPDFWGYVG